MKKYPCEKCGTRHKPSRHHILPKIFWNGYGGICWLCVGCYRQIEDVIRKTEIQVSGQKGWRFKLDQDHYKQILHDFLNEYPKEWVFQLRKE